MIQRIAIYGGTFDPIHFGHLRSIEELRERLSLDCVRLIPSYTPPHRGQPGATSKQRLDMLHLATDNLSNMIVDDREVRRKGTSYTVDTLAELRSEYGATVQIVFVLGSDAFALLHEWHKWQELTNYVHLVVMERPQANAQITDGLVLEWLEARSVKGVEQLIGPSGQVARVRLSPIDISATEIRRRVRTGESLEDFVPLEVANYIDEHKLYV